MQFTTKRGLEVTIGNPDDKPVDHIRNTVERGEKIAAALSAAGLAFSAFKSGEKHTSRFEKGAGILRKVATLGTAALTLHHAAHELASAFGFGASETDEDPSAEEATEAALTSEMQNQRQIEFSDELPVI